MREFPHMRVRLHVWGTRRYRFNQTAAILRFAQNDDLGEFVSKLFAKMKNVPYSGA